ncbi:MAG: hypothetical protein M5U01_43580 [Ardenticatenaceae bacterium]|nr:hypothetical protein [Ardenticatenaceae bacterium]HBY98589.1 hypothetical protein [Chloroflexota bacterium]
MEIKVAEQCAYQLIEQLSWQEVRERAWDKKADAFGALSKWIMRPNPREIQISYEEKRYEPFWHVACRTHYVYDRLRQYPIIVDGPHVYRVTIQGVDYTPGVENNVARVTLQGVEHCREDSRREALVDAISGEPGPFGQYLDKPKQAITWGEWDPENAIVVAPEVRASGVVRQLLSQLIKPLDADQIFEEEVIVENVDLYFRPIYAFEYQWPAKAKQAIIELDGLTGEVRKDGRAVRVELEKVMNRELLFDVGAEAVNLIIPGGGIAIKAVQHLSASSHKPPG